MSATMELLDNLAQSGTSVAHSVDYKWNMEWWERRSGINYL